MGKILIVEDDLDIRTILKIYLKREGFKVIESANGVEAEEYLDRDLDLVLLDLMLPDVDGLVLCKRIRERYNYPIIMITAKTGDMDKIKGLEYGADDYITKPFNPLEVIARVKAQIRRYHDYQSGDKENKDKIIYHKGLSLNKKSKEIQINEEIINLTPTEFKILKTLLERKGEVISGENLFKMIWKDEYYSKETNTITVHIQNLREKLGKASKDIDYIKTVWGVGYIIEE